MTYPAPAVLGLGAGVSRATILYCTVLYCTVLYLQCSGSGPVSPEVLLDSDMQLLPAVSWPLLSSLAGDSSPELVPDPEPDKVRCRAGPHRLRPPLPGMCWPGPVL